MTVTGIQAAGDGKEQYESDLSVTVVCERVCVRACVPVEPRYYLPFNSNAISLHSSVEPVTTTSL